jgi:flavodoxin
MDTEHNKTLKALIIYFSATGNTEKVAHRIYESLAKENVDATLLKVKESGDVELYDYDLVFLGSPAMEFLPAQPVINFIKEKMKMHRKRGDIKVYAPQIPGKTAVVFATYSGPHTGVNEVITATKYMGQLFEHIGFKVAGEWHTVGEFHKREDLSTRGKLGDIRGRPNETDLAEIEEKVSVLIKSLPTS